MTDGPELDAERRGERKPGPGPLYPATNAPWVDPTVSGPTVDFIRECFAWSHEVRSADHAAMTRQLAALNARGIEPEWLQDQFTLVQQQLATLAEQTGRPSNADRAARAQSEYDRGVADGRASITLVSDEVLNGRLIPFDVHQQAISNATQNGRVAGFDAGKSIGQAEREAELLEQGWTPPGAVLESVLEPARHEIHAYEVWRDALNLAVAWFPAGAADEDITDQAGIFWDRLIAGPPGLEDVYMRFEDGGPDPRKRWERSTVASEHEAAASTADPIDGDETSWGPMPTIDPTNTPIDDPRDAGPY